MYVSQLSEEKQLEIKEKLEQQGFSYEDIEIAMSSKIEDIDYLIKN